MKIHCTCLAVIALSFLLAPVSLGACGEAAAPTTQEDAMTSGTIAADTTRYQPSDDPYYENDKKLIMQAIEVSDEQADYDIRKLRALGVEGIVGVTLENGEGLFERDIKLVDINNTEYSVYYTFKDEIKRDELEGIGGLYIDVEKEDVTERTIVYGWSEHPYDFITEEDWDYYYLDLRP